MKRNTIFAGTKTLIAACACVWICSAQLASASDWQLSIAGGTGQARDPSSDESTSNVELNNDQVIYLVANKLESTGTDGERLYTEFFLASNVITADVDSGSPYETEIEAYHLHLGGIYEWVPSERFNPYFAMTLGISHYTPELSDEDTYFSGSVGIGSKIWLTQRLALRLEARALGTLLNSSSTIFCGESDDDCAIGVDGTLWTQQHYTAGLTWAF